MKIETKKVELGKYYKVFVNGQRIGDIHDTCQGINEWYFEGADELEFDTSISAIGYGNVKKSVVAAIKDHLENFESVWNRVVIS